MEVVEDVGIPEDILKDLASKDIAEEPQAKPKQKKEEKSSAWGLKKKKELNEEILKEIQKKLAEAWELMGTEYGRKLIEDVAVEVKKLCIINDLP
ncbi:hypothetical protein TK0396 [Thermococcus kodakarensis KOD1]|uniref:Uncharacterized protein n=1 Tax=Thermococcus kodakarensis (strain ATCC BAA-918 / JCM 12380 / KOD1) TaxID=69014 RepID=Q5JG89_THEKO|nr:hypothetical protein [Thermococcus kodakarensis]WCN28467.1 hypothetical protein POG15_02025 [Thermococcus kodakarensis]WCN30763.1 hypothetical protein POG21_02025 [Thermococcus kodakarensis]BAD84585.1 hypothetical protein TK0396 [Thermococcus kodakarensis KOD1]